MTPLGKRAYGPESPQCRVICAVDGVRFDSPGDVIRPCVVVWIGFVRSVSVMALVTVHGHLPVLSDTESNYT